MSDAPGCLYGIGIGPGDGGLMTVKGAAVLQRVGTVFVPRSAAAKGSLALQVAEEHIGAGAKIEPLLFPMTRSRRELDDHWRQAAAPVVDALQGGDAAFLTIGDPMFYSTFIYLRRAVRALLPAVRIESVPGISAPFAAASAAGLALAEADDCVAVITGNNIDKLERLLADFQTIVIMKVADKWSEIRAAITVLGLEDAAIVAHRVGTDRETIESIAAVSEDRALSYMSTVIIGAHHE